MNYIARYDKIQRLVLEREVKRIHFWNVQEVVLRKIGEQKFLAPNEFAAEPRATAHVNPHCVGFDVLVHPFVATSDQQSEILTLSTGKIRSRAENVAFASH